ncbi:uncharacterized protein MELLADRAFT_73206 [Melampsora larici-populina 98AG31]|uniref:Uncharacterized protein n=1 Tax=Melampsora larici-populina (strain 98AG31 / pathotype 3-4-7) TaxID=747676 RepID=F4S4W4_MELLP|nr:uncharacterized protein MELLADRAFT_73206 [Melampsora larici-populina 98AG31]EGG00313.1 hypothetical protein MELLADRAFT_73206 [Melampsora larici-populina 98AG31]
MNNKNAVPIHTLSLIKNLNYHSSWPLQSLTTQSQMKRETRAWCSENLNFKELDLLLSLSEHVVDSSEPRSKGSPMVACPKRHSSLPIHFDPKTRRLSYSRNNSRVRLQSTLRGSQILTNGLSSADSELPTEGSSDDTSWPCADLGADLWRSTKLGLDTSHNPSLSFPLPPRRILLQPMTQGSELLTQDVPSGSLQSLCSRTSSSPELRTPVRAAHAEAEDCDPYLVFGNQLAQSYPRAIEHVSDDTSPLKDRKKSVDTDSREDSEGLYTDAVTSFLRLSLLPSSVEKDPAVRQSIAFPDSGLHIQPSSDDGTVCFSGILPSASLSPVVDYAQSFHSVKGSIGSTLPMNDASFWSTNLRATESQNTLDLSSDCSWVSAASHIEFTEGETLRPDDPTIFNKGMSTSTTPKVSDGSTYRGICGTKIIRATPTLQSDLVESPRIPSGPHKGTIGDQVLGYTQQEPHNFRIGLGLEDQQIRRRKNLQSVLGAGFHMNMLQPDIMKLEAAPEKSPLKNTLSFWTRKVQSAPKKLKKMTPKTIRQHQLESVSTLDVQIAVQHGYHFSFPESSNS